MKERLILTRPDSSMREEIEAYRKEFLDAGDSMDGTGSLRRVKTAEEWLQIRALYENPETVPEGLVPATQYVLWREEDGKLLGMLQFRHCLNAYLKQYAGHIGYSVRPSERRRGYAKRMLAEVLPICREKGLSRVMITCYTDNEGSRRTILSGGGIYESTVLDPEDGRYLERYWIPLQKTRNLE